ncbi:MULTISPECIES: hypothetical protein [unclassified Nocardiopsis]|uniref:hypothetical protein n=1 Tax=unclassified Nocardiopsis TaxID=2649073 RepID=UPI001357D7E6|nr:MULTISPECIES: hypothetical protein [unclassified Nocardiopsis]
MEPASIRLIGHGLYSLAIALILTTAPFGASVTTPVQAVLVLAGIVLAGGCVSAALLSWPPPRHILLGVGLYAVVAGVLYVTHHSALGPAAQLGFLLLFVTQIPLATAAYLRETRARELRAVATHG